MLIITDLSKSYGDRSILDHLNLTINAGEVYGLLGPNGAGKTTVINLICNLLKPDSGMIKINQKSLSSKTKSFLFSLSSSWIFIIAFRLKIMKSSSKAYLVAWSS